MRTQQGLDTVQTGRESFKVGLGGARQHAHQHLMTDFGRVGARQRRQGGQDLALGLARQALLARVLHEHDAPIGRKGQPQQQRCRRAGGRRSGVEQ